MTWFTVVLGVFIGWVTLRGGSVWPAVLAHAVTNGFAAASMLVLKGEPNPLLGPTPVGIIASLPIAYFAFRILSSRWAKNETESND
jgi:predicted aconitase with swiveling domain